MLHTCLLFEKRNHSGGLSLHSLNSGTERASCPTNYAWSVASWFCINHVIKLISSCSFSPCTAGLPVLPWATMFPLLTLWLLTTLATSLMFFYINTVLHIATVVFIYIYPGVSAVHRTDSSLQARETYCSVLRDWPVSRFIPTGAGNIIPASRFKRNSSVHLHRRREHGCMKCVASLMGS